MKIYLNLRKENLDLKLISGIQSIIQIVNRILIKFKLIWRREISENS